MKINGNAIKSGMVIEHKGSLWRAIKTTHTQPGKGGAYLQVELKDIRSGTKLNERFRSSETIERAQLEQKEHQFLFTDNDTLTFMDIDSFEQVTIGVDLLNDNQVAFIQDGMTVTIESHEGNILGIRLPDSISLTVTEADAVVKGQTASSSYKPAMLENGVKCLVPPHIEAGARIVVNTTDGSYVERAKD